MEDNNDFKDFRELLDAEILIKKELSKTDSNFPINKNFRNIEVSRDIFENPPNKDCVEAENTEVKNAISSIEDSLFDNPFSNLLRSNLPNPATAVGLMDNIRTKAGFNSPAFLPGIFP